MTLPGSTISPHVATAAQQGQATRFCHCRVSRSIRSQLCAADWGKGGTHHSHRSGCVRSRDVPRCRDLADRPVGTTYSGRRSWPTRGLGRPGDGKRDEVRAVAEYRANRRKSCISAGWKVGHSRRGSSATSESSTTAERPAVAPRPSVKINQSYLIRFCTGPATWCHTQPRLGH